MKSKTELKPLRYARKKAAPKRFVNKNFQVHQNDQRYRTLTVPVDISDVDEIRNFLKKTASKWPRPYETRVACRLLEAIALNLSTDDFIGHSVIIPPQRFFEPRATITVGLWVPAAIAERLSEMKQQRPKLRKATDTDALAIFLIEAVARYIRPRLQVLIDSGARPDLVDIYPDIEAESLREELKLLRAMYKVVENDLIQERGKCQVAEIDGVSIDEDIFVQLAEAVYHRDEYKAALDREKLKTKAQLREIEELQHATIKMRYSIKE